MRGDLSICKHLVRRIGEAQKAGEGHDAESPNFTPDSPRWNHDTRIGRRHNSGTVGLLRVRNRKRGVEGTALGDAGMLASIATARTGMAPPGRSSAELELRLAATFEADSGRLATKGLLEKKVERLNLF